MVYLVTFISYQLNFLSLKMHRKNKFYVINLTDIYLTLLKSKK